MTLKKKLTALLREILAEADANPQFRDRLADALTPDTKSPKKAKAVARGPAASPHHKRPSNRRAPAILDPVQLAREGESVLRHALAKLDIEQLRDVVADYGMDPGKLVMKWRDVDRIVDRIVEVSRGRAQKGSAFRTPSDGSDRIADAPHDAAPHHAETELPIEPGGASDVKRPD